VVEFHNEIEQAAPAVLAHHLKEGDFSRWFGLCLKDHELAGWLADIEAGVRRSGVSEEHARGQVVRAVERRYNAGSPGAREDGTKDA
jgi:hypothetical protein